MLSRLLGDRQSGVDRRERAVQIPPQGFKLGEQTVERRRAALVAEREIGRKRLLEPDRSRRRVVQLAARPVRVHPAEVGIGLQVALLRQLKQRFHRDPRGGRVAAAAFNDGLEEERAGDRRRMAEFVGAAGRLVNELAGSLELAQMPFGQREEVRRAHLGVIAEPEQRSLVPLADIIAEGPLENAARRLQVAKLERDKTENPASDAGLRVALLGFRFPEEGLGCL